jgi:hypothetical protein
VGVFAKRQVVFVEEVQEAALVVPGWCERGGRRHAKCVGREAVEYFKQRHEFGPPCTSF